MRKKIVSLTMFDFIKGIGILLVLLRHSIAWEVGNTWGWRILMSVLMPIFFITSGFWMKKQKLKKGLTGNCRLLLKPYAITLAVILSIGFAHRLIQNNLQEWIELFLIPSVLVKSGADTRIGAMWFVFALFIGWSLYYLLINIKSEKIQGIAVLILGIFGGLSMAWELPFQISQGCAAAFWVYAGFRIKKGKLFEIKLPWYAYVGMGIWWALSVVWGSMDLAFYDVKYGIFSIVGSLCGSFLVIKVFIQLNLIENPIVIGCMDKVRFIGRYTMWILCIHSIESAIVPWKILFRFVDQNTWMGCAVQLVCRTVLILVCCIVLDYSMKFFEKRS